jgi:hypothetical protein
VRRREYRVATSASLSIFATVQVVQLPADGYWLQQVHLARPRQLRLLLHQQPQLLQQRLLRLRQRPHRRLQQRQHLLHVQVRHQDPVRHQGLGLLRRRGPDARWSVRSD